MACWSSSSSSVCTVIESPNAHDGISCVISVSTILNGDVQFPDNSVAVSGIYAIGTSYKLDMPLTIHLEHCVQLSNEEDVQTMSFCKAEYASTPPPYEFIPCDGGTFSVGSRYGSLDCQSSTYLIAILRSWITGIPDPTIRYRAQVLYATRPTDGMQIVYIFVIKNIEMLLEVCQ